MLTEILHEDPHKMSATAIESEVDAYINAYADLRNFAQFQNAFDPSQPAAVRKLFL